MNTLTMILIVPVQSKEASFRKFVIYTSLYRQPLHILPRRAALHVSSRGFRSKLGHALATARRIQTCGLSLTRPSLRENTFVGN